MSDLGTLNLDFSSMTPSIDLSSLGSGSLVDTNTISTDGLNLNSTDAFNISGPLFDPSNLNTNFPSLDPVSPNSGTSTGNNSGTSTDTSAADGGVNWSNVLGTIGGIGVLGLKTFGAIQSVNARAQAASTITANQMALQQAQQQALFAQQAAANRTNPLLAFQSGSIMPWVILAGVVYFLMGKK